jgi:hypothetical protein
MAITYPVSWPFSVNLAALGVEDYRHYTLIWPIPTEFPARALNAPRDFDGAALHRFIAGE